MLTNPGPVLADTLTVEMSRTPGQNFYRKALKYGILHTEDVLDLIEW